jgi:hypothetical protein
MAPHGATQTSPYELVYGHHAILPWEMQSDSRRIILQKDLSSKDFNDLMMDELEDLHMIGRKALLPIWTKYSAFGKWSPNWEGPFQVVRCTLRNAHILKTLLGEEFTAAINGRYLKKYYPSIEVDC